MESLAFRVSGVCLEINRLEDETALLVLSDDLAETAETAECCEEAIVASISGNTFLGTDVITDKETGLSHADEAVHDAAFFVVDVSNHGAIHAGTEEPC